MKSSGRSFSTPPTGEIDAVRYLLGVVCGSKLLT